ncbi:MAG: DNA polymerase III subunit delta [Candidatus Aquicultor sp.]|nr:DNA polymerase III subunit delta [Candidatus Aquicultor sp.]
MNKKPAQSAKQKPLKPVYLIHGDKKLIDEALARLKKRISAQFDLDFNYDQFNGAEVSAAKVIQAANTLPFMSEKRLVVVKNAEKLSRDDAGQLAEYAEKPSEFACVVFVSNSANKTSRLYKAVEKTGEIAEYSLKILNKSPTVWIKEQFAARGKLVSDAVARHLLHVVGSDLNRLATEIEKISLYCEDERIIDPDEVDPVVTRSTEVSIFDLSTHIGERNVPKAIELLDQLLTQKEAPLGLLSLIARHFRLILRTKVWTEAGRDSRYLVENLTGEGGKKLPPFVVSKYREQSRNFSIEELKRAFELLLKADIALKSSPQPPEAVLEDLVVRLAV